MFLAAACVLLGGISRCFRTKIPVSIVKQLILLYEYSLLIDVRSKLRYVNVRLPGLYQGGYSRTYNTILLVLVLISYYVPVQSTRD